MITLVCSVSLKRAQPAVASGIRAHAWPLMLARGLELVARAVTAAECYLVQSGIIKLRRHLAPRDGEQHRFVSDSAVNNDSRHLLDLERNTLVIDLLTLGHDTTRSVIDVDQTSEVEHPTVALMCCYRTSAVRQLPGVRGSGPVFLERSGMIVVRLPAGFQHISPITSQR